MTIAKRCCKKVIREELAADSCLVVPKDHTHFTNLQLKEAGLFKYLWHFVTTTRERVKYNFDHGKDETQIKDTEISSGNDKNFKLCKVSVTVIQTPIMQIDWLLSIHSVSLDTDPSCKLQTSNFLCHPRHWKT